jgi:DNA processing protein
MIKKELKDSILHLSLIPGVGPKTICKLTNSYLNYENDFYLFGINDFLKVGLSKEKAELIYYGLKDDKLLKEELMLLEKNKASFLTPYEYLYSNQLKEQYSYPSILYQQNNDIDFNINKYIVLGVVSSRQTNEYGKRVIDLLFKELFGYDILILSGGAIGGDTFIHEAALKYNLKTVVCLGSGLGYWYPKQNEFLFKNIIKSGGSILSHFPLSIQASRITFPVRNSVIAGLSHGVLVIQAGENSGTLITANYALQYNKQVGAVPGYIDDRIMIESNNLIKNGAYCITSGQDILEMLKINFNKEQKINKIIDLDLSSNQLLLLQLCIEPISIDALSLKLEISFDQLYEDLFFLIEKKYIKQDILGNWVKIKLLLNIVFYIVFVA